MKITNRHTALALYAASLGLFSAGCLARWDAATQWVLRGWEPTVASAERRAMESHRPVLFYFKDARIRRTDVERMIEEVVSELPAPRPVRCILYNTNERDRRYAAQFGVEIPPSLILVYPDGTYHAKRAAFNRESIARFLSEAQHPGDAPTANPYIRSRLVRAGQ